MHTNIGCTGCNILICGSSAPLFLPDGAVFAEPSSLQSRHIFSGYDTGYEYSMLPSWMIKLTEGWGKPKKASEEEDDGFKKEERDVPHLPLLH